MSSLRYYLTLFSVITFLVVIFQLARVADRDLGAETYAAIVAAVDSGMSEVEAAEIAGVNRMTVRRALGKL